MQNVITKIKGNKLIIEIDISKEHGLSKSGKTIIIGSSLGNKTLDNGVVFGLNVYKYPQTKGVM